MTGKTRKKYSGQFKLNCVKEALKSGNLTEVARHYGVNMHVLSKWKARFEEEGTKIFDSPIDRENTKLKRKVSNLERLVGQKEVELKVLQNFLDDYPEIT